MIVYLELVRVHIGNTASKPHVTADVINVKVFKSSRVTLKTVVDIIIGVDVTRNYCGDDVTGFSVSADVDVDDWRGEERFVGIARDLDEDE